MREYAFELQARTGRLAADLESITEAADREVRARAAELLREREYNGVRVVAEWVGETAIRLRIDRAKRESEARSVADFFAHELFLLMNLAVPGSIGVAEPQLDAYAFEVAWVAAARNGWPSIGPLPLARVIAWYDGLRLGTSQLATTPVARALFAMLHLATIGDPSEPAALLLLGQALEALDIREPRLARFLVLRGEAIAGATLIHPLHDESLDPRIEDADRETIEEADLAASVVVAAIQARIT